MGHDEEQPGADGRLVSTVAALQEASAHGDASRTCALLTACVEDSRAARSPEAAAAAWQTIAGVLRSHQPEVSDRRGASVGGPHPATNNNPHNHQSRSGVVHTRGACREPALLDGCGRAA